MNVKCIKDKQQKMYHYLIPSSNDKLTLCNMMSVKGSEEYLDSPPKFRKLCEECMIVYNVVAEMLTKYPKIEDVPKEEQVYLDE